MEAARLSVVIIVSLWNLKGISVAGLGSAAADVLVKFQSDWKSLDLNLAAMRLCEILQKYVFSLCEWKPRIMWLGAIGDSSRITQRSVEGRLFLDCSVSVGYIYDCRKVHDCLMIDRQWLGKCSLTINCTGIICNHWNCQRHIASQFPSRTTKIFRRSIWWKRGFSCSNKKHPCDHIVHTPSL